MMFYLNGLGWVNKVVHRNKEVERKIHDTFEGRDNRRKELAWNFRGSQDREIEVDDKDCFVGIDSKRFVDNSWELGH
jgi:hypothetical protein